MAEFTRLRRLRKTGAIRDMTRETRLDARDFIYPVFVEHGRGVKREVESMPGVYRYSVDMLPEILDRAKKAGIAGVLLFGIPERKDECGTGAYDENGPAQNAARLIKKDYPEILTVADICLCEYTSHGHCGIVQNGRVMNDETLPLLAKSAVSMAGAGADIIAPSDMMDGRVAYIRRELDAAGFLDMPIMSYSAKFASGFYSPFRDAADSAPEFGDRRAYQMDCANAREAMREIEADIAEGADIIMVKPALAYLDIVRRAAEGFKAPLAAYNVSGEYSMVKAAAANGWIDEKRIVGETLTAIKRAGADIIISYHALDAAEWLREGII